MGGAQLSQLGSTSSGLTGLTDRVHAVDGRLDIVSRELTALEQVELDNAVKSNFKRPVTI